MLDCINPKILSYCNQFIKDHHITFISRLRQIKPGVKQSISPPLEESEIREGLEYAEKCHCIADPSKELKNKEDLKKIVASYDAARAKGWTGGKMQPYEAIGQCEDVKLQESCEYYSTMSSEDRFRTLGALREDSPIPQGYTAEDLHHAYLFEKDCGCLKSTFRRFGNLKALEKHAKEYEALLEAKKQCPNSADCEKKSEDRYVKSWINNGAINFEGIFSLENRISTSREVFSYAKECSCYNTKVLKLEKEKINSLVEQMKGLKSEKDNQELIAKKELADQEAAAKKEEQERLIAEKNAALLDAKLKSPACNAVRTYLNYCDSAAHLKALQDRESQMLRINARSGTENLAEKRALAAAIVRAEDQLQASKLKLQRTKSTLTIADCKLEKDSATGWRNSESLRLKVEKVSKNDCGTTVDQID